MTRWKTRKSHLSYFLSALSTASYSVLQRETVVIVLFPEHDPKTEPWFSLSREGHPYFRVYYLTELLDELAARNPDHPLLIVFKPLFEKDDDQLRSEIGQSHRALRTSELEPEIRDALLEVFESWISLRFQNASKEELRAMFAITGELKDTRVYKEIKEELRDELSREGRKEGRKEGELRGSLKTLDDLLAKGTLTEQEHRQLTQPLREQLEALDTGQSE